MAYPPFPVLVPNMPANVERAEKTPHLGHENHLCELSKRGIDLNIYKKLAKDAKFICTKCGRAAGKEENLCEPVPL